MATPDTHAFCFRRSPVVVWITRTSDCRTSMTASARCSTCASRSSTAKHSSAEPRAIAVNRACSARVNRPWPSARLRTMLAAARRN